MENSFEQTPDVSPNCECRNNRGTWFLLYKICVYLRPSVVSLLFK